MCVGWSGDGFLDVFNGEIDRVVVVDVNLDVCVQGGRVWGGLCVRW